MIDDPHFSLELESTWQRLYPDDCRQYTFSDDRRDIVIILSASSQDIAPHDLDYFCGLLVDLQI